MKVTIVTKRKKPNEKPSIQKLKLKNYHRIVKISHLKENND